jgi:hypothetical protein
VAAIVGWVPIERLHVPWDIEVARLNFGANCGPVAFATILRKEVCRAMRYFRHFENGRWTNLTKMKQAFAEAGYEATVVRQELPNNGVVLIQWLGPWTSRHFFSKWSLMHTHWVAVRGDFIFDHTRGEWLTFLEWQNEVVPQFLATIPQAAGWAIKYGIEIESSGSSKGVSVDATMGELSLAM